MSSLKTLILNNLKTPTSSTVSAADKKSAASSKHDSDSKNDDVSRMQLFNTS